MENQENESERDKIVQYDPQSGADVGLPKSARNSFRDLIKFIS